MKKNTTPDTLIRRMPLQGGVSAPVATPIQPSVVYASPSIADLHAQYDGRVQGYTYAREGHPNADQLAARIDQLEAGQGGMIVGSGMAAVTAALMGLLSAGDHVIGSDQLYGRSLRLMNQDLARFGIATSVVDASAAENIASALRPETRMILIEVVANPTLRIADLEGIAALAKDRGIILAVDNTFATPRSLRPLEFGADIVIHSVTKLLAGHADVTLGYVMARDAQHRKAIYDFATTTGLTPSPYECWLAERGLFTFDLRFDRAEETARDLANFLGNHPAVSRVLYPGRDDHPDRARAAHLLAGRDGNMVSFEIQGGEPAAERFVAAAPGLVFAPTLGDVATTLSHPASSSHRAMSADARATLGISDGFFRVSVGIEGLDMLEREFSAGLAAAHGG
ncbi:MAG: aminotransferase class I/II-fold pyridoxal phosphate-dependent enzyme [Pseudomonadota bacterium]